MTKIDGFRTTMIRADLAIIIKHCIKELLRNSHSMISNMIIGNNIDIFSFISALKNLWI